MGGTKKSNNRLIWGNPKFKLIALSLVLAGLFLLGYYIITSRAATTPEIGVNFHATWSDYNDTQRAAVLDKLAAANVKWIRVDIGWASLEEAGSGQPSNWYYQIIDSTVSMAKARNISVLGTVLSTPSWANGGKGTAYPPDDMSAYGRVMAQLATRYKGRVAAWEVWNEPNLEDFWAGKDPAKYVSLLKTTYPHIKAADPNALVIFGGTSLNDVDWITKAYDAGAKGYFDVMNTHPYVAPSDAPPEKPDDGSPYTIAAAKRVHDLMVTRGDGNKPIWFTEFGWSSHANAPGTPNWSLGVSEAQQADYLTRAYKYISANMPYVQTAFWYTERNTSDGDLHNKNYGLLNYDLSSKPAYTALKSYGKTTPTPTDSSKPAAPSGINVISSTETSLTIGWNKNTEANVNSYTVRYKPSSSSTWTQLSPTSTTTQTITGLVAATGYNIEVTATNSTNVTSDPAAILATTKSSTATTTPTPAPAPSPEPTPVAPVNITNFTRALKFDWQRGRNYFRLNWANSGGKARGYSLYVNIGTVAPANRGNPYATLDGNMNGFRYYGPQAKLQTGVKYNFRLVPINDDGSLATSAVTSAMIHCTLNYFCSLDPNYQ